MILINILLLSDKIINLIITDLQKKYPDKTLKKILKPGKLYLSEIVTIGIYYHFSQFKNFKSYFKYNVEKNMNNKFKNLCSYNRFIELKNEFQYVFEIILEYMLKNNIFDKINNSNMYFIDSTVIKVCDIKRAHNHKTMKMYAKKTKSWNEWKFGMKLHCICNEKQEIINISITPANIADANQKNILELLKPIKGIVYGDRGYILSNDTKNILSQTECKVLTRQRKNAKYKMKISTEDEKAFLKRNNIESLFNILKNYFELEHSRHRSVAGFFVHLYGLLISFLIKKNIDLKIII